MCHAHLLMLNIGNIDRKPAVQNTYLNKKEKDTMYWERDSPSLVLQWLDNKLVLMLSTIHKANDHGVVNRKRKEHGVRNISKVP